MYGFLLTNRVTFNLLKRLWYAKVREHRVFSLASIKPRDKWDLSKKAETEVCHSLIRLLVENAEEAFVYGVTTDSPHFSTFEHFLAPQRGKCRIDLKAGCIDGFEDFWLTSYDFKRGSILFRVRYDKQIMHKALRLLYNPIHVNNPGSVHTKSAIQFAKRKAEETEEVYFAFPVSGIWQVEIISTPGYTLRLFKTAGWKCRFALDPM